MSETKKKKVVVVEPVGSVGNGEAVVQAAVGEPQARPRGRWDGGGQPEGLSTDGPRAPAAASLSTGSGSRVPDPEVAERPARRQFNADYKRSILEEADQCAAGAGEVGALLRREGLYSSHLVTWRRQRDEGTLAGLAPKKRGRKPAAKNPFATKVAEQEREIRKLRARAERAEGLVEVQKKLAELLGQEIPSEEEVLEAERRGLPIPSWRKKR